MSVTRARVCERAETEGCPRAELRQGDYPGTDRQTNTDFSQRAPRFIEGGAQASVTRVTSQSSAPTAHATCGDTSTGRDARQSPEVPPSGTEVGLVPPFGPPPPVISIPCPLHQVLPPALKHTHRLPQRHGCHRRSHRDTHAWDGRAQARAQRLPAGVGAGSKLSVTGGRTRSVTSRLRPPQLAYISIH